MLLETLLYFIIQEATTCSENNGGCEDQCEESIATGDIVCSCDIPGTALSPNMKSCMGKGQLYYFNMNQIITYYKRKKVIHN